MEQFIIKKNSEVDDDLLDKVLEFDRTIFPIDENYSFPDKLYVNSKDGFFVLLHNGNVVGYVNCIFLSEEVKNNYLETKDYLTLTNNGFNIGDNNMYFYTLALAREYRNSNLVKILMKNFTTWLDEEKRKGKKIKSCISEAVTTDGIKTLLRMGMIPQDTDINGLGIYSSPDCLENYIKEMNNIGELTILEERDDEER